MAVGIGLIPLLLGLFAIPEIVIQVLEGRKEKAEGGHRTESIQVTQDKMPLREFLTHWRLFLKSAAIGSFIGAMPGLGSATAAFTCYATAQKTSKHPERFGQGSIEGVIAAETGNNGTVGPAIAPLLTLAIPGSATAAVLYGSLIMNGIVPGPHIFQEHGAVVYGLFIGLLIGGVLLYPVAVSVFKYLIKYILRVDKRYLFSAVFLLCIAGAYALQNSMMDVYVMCIAGIFAYLLKRFSFPMGPLLIAFILEPILERSTRQALVLSGTNYSEVLASSYISIGLWALLLAIPLYMGVKAHRAKRVQ
jgi:putative tricarboxylic transport membrane protein